MHAEKERNNRGKRDEDEMKHKRERGLTGNPIVLPASAYQISAGDEKRSSSLTIHPPFVDPCRYIESNIGARYIIDRSQQLYIILNSVHLVR
jgi:hypothetical protein